MGIQSVWRYLECSNGTYTILCGASSGWKLAAQVMLVAETGDRQKQVKRLADREKQRLLMRRNR